MPIKSFKKFFTPWELDNMSYDDKTISPDQNTFPQDLLLSPDGTKMIIGLNGVDTRIYYYTLTTPYDLTTLTYVTYEDISDKMNNYKSFSINEEGTKLFIFALNPPTGGSPINFPRVFHYRLNTPWAVNTANYVYTFDISPEVGTSARGMTVKPDGTKMYILDGDAMVYVYNLSSPWILDTASYSGISFDAITAELDVATDIGFGEYGYRMFILDALDKKLLQYNLSVPWDVTTATYSKVFDLSSQLVDVSGFEVSHNGNKVYVARNNSNTKICQYSIS